VSSSCFVPLSCSAPIEPLLASVVLNVCSLRFPNRFVPVGLAGTPFITDSAPRLAFAIATSGHHV